MITKVNILYMSNLPGEKRKTVRFDVGPSSGAQDQTKPKPIGFGKANQRPGFNRRGSSGLVITKERSSSLKPLLLENPICVEPPIKTEKEKVVVSNDISVPTPPLEGDLSSSSVENESNQSSPQSPTSFLAALSNAPSVLLHPCSVCEQSIRDQASVYRCENCNYVECVDCCVLSPTEKRKKILRAKALRHTSVHYNTSNSGSSQLDTVSSSLSSEPSERCAVHQMKKWTWSTKPLPVNETVVSSKAVTAEGNKIINNYVIAQQLGKGSYATVKLVQQQDTGELFALKILKKFRKSTPFRVKVESKKAMSDELLREIAVMKLVDHPNIVKLHEVIDDVEEEKIYIIMEYCSGGPIHTLGAAALSVDKVRKWGSQLASALLYLHSQFLYHRDVKPANVLISEDGVAKLADFGTCDSRLRTNMLTGTPAYTCPEQVRGEEVSGEVVDSWAFAITVFQMAFGRLPFPSNLNTFGLRKVLMSDDPLEIPPYSGDGMLQDLLSRMLSKDRSQRLLLQTATNHDFFVLNVPVNRITHGLAVSKRLVGCSDDTWLDSSDSNLNIKDIAMSTVRQGRNLKGALHRASSGLAPETGSMISAARFSAMKSPRKLLVVPEFVRLPPSTTSRTSSAVSTIISSAFSEAKGSKTSKERKPGSAVGKNNSESLVDELVQPNDVYTICETIVSEDSAGCSTSSSLSSVTLGVRQKAIPEAPLNLPHLENQGSTISRSEKKGKPSPEKLSGGHYSRSSDRRKGKLEALSMPSTPSLLGSWSKNRFTELASRRPHSSSIVTIEVAVPKTAKLPPIRTSYNLFAQRR